MPVWSWDQKRKNALGSNHVSQPSRAQTPTKLPPDLEPNGHISPVWLKYFLHKRSVPNVESMVFTRLPSASRHVVLSEVWRFDSPLGATQENAMAYGCSSTESTWRLMTPRTNDPIISGSRTTKGKYGATWLDESRSHIAIMLLLMLPTSRYEFSRFACEEKCFTVASRVFRQQFQKRACRFASSQDF